MESDCDKRALSQLILKVPTTFSSTVHQCPQLISGFCPSDKPVVPYVTRYVVVGLNSSETIRTLTCLQKGSDTIFKMMMMPPLSSPLTSGHRGRGSCGEFLQSQSVSAEPLYVSRCRIHTEERIHPPVRSSSVMAPAAVLLLLGLLSSVSSLAPPRSSFLLSKSRNHLSSLISAQ